LFERLVENAVFEFEDRSVLLQAIAAFRRSRAGFVDHLIGAKAQALGATTTWTFDRALKNCAEFSILG
jgi:predicted nucleic-acid-binding protein